MANSKYTIIITLLALSLSACTMPSNTQESEGAGAVLTAAAQTVEANLTQSANPTATLLPPTDTPVPLPSATLVAPQPTNTLLVVPTSTQDCDQAQFIKDVNIPDGTKFTKNESFVKTWRLKNVGTCTWSGYSLVFDTGDAMGGAASLPIGTVAPGQEVDISVALKAPDTDGSYKGYWRIKNSAGVLIPVQKGYQGKSFFVEIQVGELDNNSQFAVTGVTMSVSGACGNFQITANITTNAPGAVTYKWKRSDNATDTANHPDLIFDVAGTKSVSTTWSVSASGSHWMDIYIDDPNHQQFGRANFNCP